MLSFKESFSGFAGLLLLTGAITQLVGCIQSTSPTAPTSITFLFDSNLQGSEWQLTGFDGLNQLSFKTTNGASTALFDNNTVFRNAHLDEFTPVDPCRDFAAAYNKAGASYDTGGVFSAISSLATNGCLARILTDQYDPRPAPIKSFRPLATF